MVRIRLRRVGKRKQPLYRVVVADARSPRDGRFIEIIGQYNPLTNPSSIAIEHDAALAWLRKGAQPSEQVKSLLKRTGIWSEYVKDRGPAPRKQKKHAKIAPTPVKAAAELPVQKAPEPAAAPVEPVAEPTPAEATDEVRATEESSQATTTES